MIETARASEWLYTTLSSDAQLNALIGGRVYRWVAPEGAALPFVVFQLQSARDVQTAGPYRVMTQLTYTVKAVGRASEYQTLRDIADRVDALLQSASGSTADAYIIACVRERPVEYEESEDGVRYQHLGGMYVITAQKA